MKRTYFLIVMIATVYLQIKAHAEYVYITNNGQVDLIVNNTPIPSEPMHTKAYPVPITNSALIIRLSKDKNSSQKVKLLASDIGSTIKVGGYYHPSQRRYLAYVLRSDKNPILICLKKLNRSLGIPRRF